MKTTYESNDSPLNVDDACHRLVEEEMESRKKRWFKFRDLLIEAGLVIPIEEWPIPTDWGSKNVNLMYAHLREQINWSLDKIRNSSNLMTPQDNWELLLPDVFSFDLGHFAFRPMETYDDGIYRTVTLTDGSAINISKSSDSSYITYPPRDECVAALEEYIREGVRISKQIDSTSNRTWRKADAIFRKHRTLIDLPTSYRAMRELGDLLHDARIELTLDIEDYVATQEESKKEAIIDHDSTQPTHKEISERYLSIEKRLAVYAKMNPNITRFKLLCSLLADGISEACHGDSDLEVWKEPWIAATLQLMSEDPCDGDCNLLNRQILFNAIISPFTKLVDLLTILQSTDADALADEYDYFFQDINDIMSKCWQKQPGTGKSGVIITPTFLTRESPNDGWEFDARNIRKLASHCEAQNAIAIYKQKAISQEDQLQVNAVNIPKSDSSSGNLCTHLLFASATSDAEKIVTALESASAETFSTIFSGGCSPLTIFQPFYATYYTPYTYYPEKSNKDAELGLSIPDDISTLKSWIDRLFKCLQKFKNCEAATSAAISQWKKIEALYDFRNLNPSLRLSREQQNDFSNKIIELERLLISAAQNNETRPRTAAPLKVTTPPKTIGEIPVDEFWSRFNKEKNKAKIGAPSANDHTGNAYTQPQIAKMFGPPCTTQKVANWEAKARGANRGSTPPSAKYKGRLVSYREDLRKFPIGENVEILAAIIEQYKATEGAKYAVSKIDKVHYRTPETLAKASGQTDAAIREQSHLKYEK